MMTYDEIQWFWAPEAAQKCAEDRAAPVGAGCTDFYYRDVNDGLRTTPLDPGVIMTLVPNGPPPESATLAQLAAQPSKGVEFPCVLPIDGASSPGSTRSSATVAPRRWVRGQGLGIVDSAVM